MKKILPILTLVLALFALTGCEEEASKTTHATNINSTEKAVKESPKKGIDRTHNLTVQGQTLTLTSSYQVDERNLNNYVFTTPSVIDERPFQVESVNQNEQFIHGWNGYISSDYSYLTKHDIRSSSDGAVLRTVWTLAIEDTETHQIFSKTLSDTIFMPSHEDKK